MKKFRIGKAVVGVVKNVRDSKVHKSPSGASYKFDDSKDYEDMSMEDKINFSKYFKSIDNFYHTYECPKCGGDMEFEDDMEDVLICEDCGYDMPYERYGFDDDVFDALNIFPTYDELIFNERVESGEIESPHDVDAAIKAEYDAYGYVYDDDDD